MKFTLRLIKEEVEQISSYLGTSNSYLNLQHLDLMQNSFKKISLTKQQAKDCLSCLFSFHFCHSFPVDKHTTECVFCIVKWWLVQSGNLTRKYGPSMQRLFSAMQMSRSKRTMWELHGTELPVTPLIPDIVCFTVAAFVRKQTSSDF